MQFTIEETTLLLEALDALETKAGGDMLIGGLLGAAFARNEQQAKENIEKMKQEMDEKKDKDRALKEQLILLRAKVIQSRNVCLQTGG